MAKKTGHVPDLYFPDEDQELQASSVEGEGGHGPGGQVTKKKPVDLTIEGFIPIHKLTLEDLPEPIRSKENLQLILDISKNVVRIHNNRLSDKRPDDDEFKQKKQKSLSGSGSLKKFGGNEVLITTNRHVLFNEEELQLSTFDVFYDYSNGDSDGKKMPFRRSPRKNGKRFIGKYSHDDIAHAVFKVNEAMKALIEKEWSDDEILYRHAERTWHQSGKHDLNMAPTVCLISHPLGQLKHVSFGEMIRYNMQSRIVYHNAPSKPGSSGGPLIVFPNAKVCLPFSICHVGRDLESGEKYAKVQYFESSQLDSFTALPAESQQVSKDDNPAAELAQEASISLDIACLAALVPIFGAFLLHMEETSLAGLNTCALKPCKTSLANESLTSLDLKQSVTEIINKLAQRAPSFTQCPLGSFEDVSGLARLLESQGPCYCQSIVKMMERGVKLEDGTDTECFLSPYTAAAKMSSDGDVTWPWLKGSHVDLRCDDPKEDCLLKKCLKFCDRGFIPVMLLLMITKANIRMKQLFPQSNGVSLVRTTSEDENQWQTLYRRTTQVCPSEPNAMKQPGVTQVSPLAREKKFKALQADAEEDYHRLTTDVLALLSLGLQTTSLSRFGMRLININKKEIPQEERKGNLGLLYSRCLAVAEHALQHEQQIHPDTVRGGRDGSSGNWCRCGRPGTSELLVGVASLSDLYAREMTSDSKSKHTTACQPDEMPIERPDGLVPFLHFLLAIQKSENSLPPGKNILIHFDELKPESCVDELDTFPHGSLSLMLFLASEEVFRYNYCLLAKHISKQLQSLYFAFPVSVFGRPGNWPGNVTPPEVQRTAWRLIQDAIMASGFPPAVLAALEKDAERREKLIDLYVDMKQLKWQGRIQPHLFREYVEMSHKLLVDHCRFVVPFVNATRYVVWYSVYLVCPEIVGPRKHVS